MSVELISFSFLKKPEDRHDAERIYEELQKVESQTIENKLELIKAMGDVFVIAQVPQADISTKLTECIGDIVAPSWIRNVCKKQGWTDPRFVNSNIRNRNDVRASTSASDTSDSLNTFVHSWEQRLQDARTQRQIELEDKGSTPEESKLLAEQQINLEDIIPHYPVRIPYYKFLKETIELFRKFLEEIQKDFDEEKDDAGKTFRQPRDWTKLYESIGDMNEYHAALGMLYKRASQAYEHHDELMTVDRNAKSSGAKAVDNRQSILPYMYFPILAKLSITTIKHFASKHFALVRAVYDITTKKTTQFAKSPDSVSDLLESTMDDAWRWHYIDIKCPQCRISTLKPRIYIDGSWEFICKNWDFHGKKQGMDEVSFKPDLFSRRINALSLNIGRASQKYLKDRKMAAPEDLRDD